MDDDLVFVTCNWVQLNQSLLQQLATATLPLTHSLFHLPTVSFLSFDEMVKTKTFI
jgi:hypothetical protein